MASISVDSTQMASISIESTEMASEEFIIRLPPPERPSMSDSPPRLMIIGAGSRGNAYAKAIVLSTNGICVAVCDPLKVARRNLGRNYIWGDREPVEGEDFEDWQDFVEWELERREKEAHGEDVPEGVDGVLICVQDELHMAVILGLQKLNLHIMCEKPLATTLEDCLAILNSVMPHDDNGRRTAPQKIFSIGHVLRYSPHNVLLRKLLLKDRVIGDILSINHTEPVGWWHFAHSYVRGNWRRNSTSAPSLLTKSCHDIDVLMWLLSSPADPSSTTPPHLPSTITSSGARQFFTKRRKPKEAGNATNCLSCPIEQDCMFSAKKIYVSDTFKGVESGNTGWPVKILIPDIENIVKSSGLEAGKKAILQELEKDFTPQTPKAEVAKNNYYGRCVWDGDNNVNDDQIVQMSWEESEDGMQGPKQATFHMVAMTAKICQRYTHIYGTRGEIYADSNTITVTDFKSPLKPDAAAAKDESASGFKTTKYYPYQAEGGHGGGDAGLARQFVLAIDRVKNHGEDVTVVQKREIGCDVEEVVRSHAVCFAAEEARVEKTVVQFPEWWRLHTKPGGSGW